MSAAGLINTGILMGMIHVLTGPDHLSALAALTGTNVSSGGTRLQAFLLGIKWGIGHTLGLVAVGGTLIAASAGGANQWIEMDPRWQNSLEGIVGLFALLLGCFGMIKAVGNYGERGIGGGGVEMTGAPGLEGQKLTPGGDGSGSASQIGSSRTSNSRRSIDSIAAAMEEALGIFRPKRGNSKGSGGVGQLSSLSHHHRNIPGKIDEGVEVEGDDLSRGSGSSFLRYLARDRPHLSRASSLLKIHAPSAENRSNGDTCCGKLCSCSCCNDGANVMAVFAGALHGAAGAGVVLGVVPASQLQDVDLAATYISTVCLTSSLVMGVFAFFYGSVSQWLAEGGKGRFHDRSSGRSRVLMVEAGSALLSIVVGAIWLILLLAGKLTGVFH